MVADPIMAGGGDILPVATGAILLLAGGVTQAFSSVTLLVAGLIF